MSAALSKRTTHGLQRDGGVAGAPLYHPEVDIVETADELLLYADMPGVDRETLDVSFEHRRLSIRARMATGLQPQGGTSIWSEYGSGSYARTFQVGEIVDAERISAEYADGVLTVHLPKVEAARPRKITITGKK